MAADGSTFPTGAPEALGVDFLPILDAGRRKLDGDARDVRLGATLVLTSALRILAHHVGEAEAMMVCAETVADIRQAHRAATRIGSR